MKKILVSTAAVVSACALVFGAAAPAHAAYSKGVGGITCGQAQLPFPEVHLTSVAKGSITHSSYSKVHGNWKVSAGSSATFFSTESHHWLRNEIVYGNVTTSSNYASSIKSAGRHCE